MLPWILLFGFGAFSMIYIQEEVCALSKFSKHAP